MSDSSSPQFRTVLRGYEPAQVDRRVRELTESLHAAHRQAEQLHRRVQDLESSPAAVPESTARPAAPTFGDFGDRIGKILALAEEEAGDLSARARSDADTHRRLAEEAGAQVRADALRYATEQRGASAAEAAQILQDARDKADDVLDEADREAAARRAEASAVYEHQRAKAAQAAADFETTLAGRRERAEQDFVARSAASEAELATIGDRAEQLRGEAERLHGDAQAQAKRLLEEARKQAEDILSAARARADRVRAESDRELTAAGQRRDSINAQLTNVRQMLATLSGTAPINPLGDDATGPSGKAPAAKGAEAQVSPVKGTPQGATGATTAEPAAAGQADAKPSQQEAAKGRAQGKDQKQPANEPEDEPEHQPHGKPAGKPEEQPGRPTLHSTSDTTHRIAPTTKK